MKIKEIIDKAATLLENANYTHVRATARRILDEATECDHAREVLSRRVERLLTINNRPEVSDAQESTKSI